MTKTLFAPGHILVLVKVKEGIGLTGLIYDEVSDSRPRQLVGSG